jgi:hypothetical protein
LSLAQSTARPRSRWLQKYAGTAANELLEFSQQHDLMGISEGRCN